MWQERDPELLPAALVQISSDWVAAGATTLLEWLTKASKELGIEILPGAGTIHRAFATMWAEALAFSYPRIPYERLTQEQKFKTWREFQDLFDAAFRSKSPSLAYMLVRRVLVKGIQASDPTVARFEADRQLALKEGIITKKGTAIWSKLPDIIIVGLLNEPPKPSTNIRVMEGKIAMYVQEFYPDEPIFNDDEQEIARIGLTVDHIISAGRAVKRILENPPEPNKPKPQFNQQIPSDPSPESAESWAVHNLSQTAFIRELIMHKGQDTLDVYEEYENVARWVLDLVKNSIAYNEHRILEFWQNISLSYPHREDLPEYPLTPQKMLEAFKPDAIIDTTHMTPVEVFLTVLDIIQRVCPSVRSMLLEYIATLQKQSDD